MDIIIDGEAFTIGIENKIFHWLANDLEDYSQYIDRLAGEKPVVVKAVLGLRRESGPLKAGFVSFTYGQFWPQASHRDEKNAGRMRFDPAIGQV